MHHISRNIRSRDMLIVSSIHRVRFLFPSLWRCYQSLCCPAVCCWGVSASSEEMPCSAWSSVLILQVASHVLLFTTIRNHHAVDEERVISDFLFVLLCPSTRAHVPYLAFLINVNDSITHVISSKDDFNKHGCFLFLIHELLFVTCPEVWESLSLLPWCLRIIRSLR